MKLTQTLLILIVSISFSFGQKKLKFEEITKMPVACLAFAYATDGEKIYILGGINKKVGSRMIFQQYNSNLDDWVYGKLQEVPSARYPSAIYVKDYESMIIAGGIIESGVNLNLQGEIYSISAETLRVATLGNLPFGGKNMGIANAGSTVYLFGGAQSLSFKASQKRALTFSDQLYSYDLATGSVTELGKIPLAMETKGVVVDEYLYIFGGYNGKASNKAWRYSLDSKSWQALPDLAKSLSANAITSYKQYIILVGNYVNMDQLIVFDTKTSEYHYFKLNFKSRHLGVAVLNDFLHAFGGVYDSTPLASHYKIPLKEILDDLDYINE